VSRFAGRDVQRRHRRRDRPSPAPRGIGSRRERGLRREGAVAVVSKGSRTSVRSRVRHREVRSPSPVQIAADNLGGAIANGVRAAELKLAFPSL
jgi:hypothetical protein